MNYNVDNWQYIVTGYNSNLETLRITLNFIKENPTRVEEIINVVTTSLSKFPDPNNVFTLNQGIATVPLVFEFMFPFLQSRLELTYPSTLSTCSQKFPNLETIS